MPVCLEVRPGFFVRIDEADLPLVGQHRWRINNGYAARTLWDRERQRTGDRVYMHRMLCPGGEVDHVDGDKLNNCRSNLRLVSSGANKQNMRPRNLHGFKGVQANRTRFQAVIWHERQRHCLGTFDDPHDAARAYDVAALRLYGTQAYINFKED